MKPWAAAAGSVALAGAGALAWGLVEAHAFTVRRCSVAVLPPGAGQLRVLHLSDLHFTPSQRDKVAWVHSLAELEPDLVVTTGDNLAHLDAVETVDEALTPFSDVPGVFVFGSNDYVEPSLKNPFTYFSGPSKVRRRSRALPTEDLRAAFAGWGWHDLNNARAQVKVAGLNVTAVGMDDPHIGRDAMPVADGTVHGDLHLGVVHAPYVRALDALRGDGAELILAGHTHGGQVCVPGFGALVTNCDLDRARAKGLSAWPGALGDGESTPLHVSAGAGTSPYAPVRFACRPEATLLTLTERP